MITVGLDLSLTSPGLCVLNDKHINFWFYPTRKKHEGFSESIGNVQFNSLIPFEWKTREERYEKMTDQLFNIIQTFSVTESIKLGIEGYSYGSQGRATLNLAEIGGVMRNKLYLNTINIIEVPPTVIKKYASGKGNSNKDVLYLHFKEEFKSQFDLFNILDIKEGKNIPHPIEDIVDSYYLAKLVRGDTHEAINVLNGIMDLLKDSTEI